MPPCRFQAVLAAVAVALCAALSPAAGAAPARTRPSSESALLKALLRSRDLWATINVCNPADQPNTVGIRGSMPGDGQAHDQMYMSFRLQFRDPASRKWIDLPDTAKAEWLHVGAGATVRQDGASFQLQPRAGRPASTLRGVVEFQWRRGSRVIQTGTRPTTLGHQSRVGADPAGFTAASCLIG